jgi:osmotically-inducible protein OsmY
MKTDEILRREVEDELQWDPKVRDVATQIGVAARDGVISLSGNVKSYPQKMAAELAAQKVGGVRVVASALKVCIHDMGKKNDIQIAEAVRNALRDDSCVNEDQIEVKVENEWVALDGMVDWSYQKLAAQKCIERLPFIMGVVNNVVVKPKSVDTKDMLRKISAAFHRSAAVDSSTIRIDAEKDKVTLHGTVKSLPEKRAAEEIAWSYPGVMMVDNQIDIAASVFPEVSYGGTLQRP